jgi:hypothetical protein
VSSITNYSARSRSEFCSTTQNGPELPPHREHGTVAGGKLAGHVDDELGQLIAARDALAGGMCPRGD